MAFTTLAVSTGIGVGRDFDINAVDLVFEIAVVVFKAPHHGVERRDDQVIAIRNFEPLDVGIGRRLLREDADHLQPGVVDLDVLADGVLIAEQVDFGRFAEHADGRRTGVVFLVEEAALHHPETVDPEVIGLHADQQGRLLRRLGKHFERFETLARRQCLQALDVFGNGAEVAEREPWRDPAAGLQLVAVDRFLGFDDDVVDAQQVDVAHHLFLRAGGDGKHGHHRAHAEDHAEHGEQAAQLVDQEARKPHVQFRKIAGNI